MNNENQKPKVGVGVIVMKDGKVLLGKRKGSHGSGEYCFLGGHLEYMESFEDCIRREVREEAGIEVKDIRFLSLMNLKDYSPKHYVDVSFVVDWASGEPEVLEPERHEFWEWRDIDNLPEPLFKSIYTYLEALKTGKNFFDA